MHVPEDRMTLGVAGASSIKENMVADKIDLEQFGNKMLTNQEAIKKADR